MQVRRNILTLSDSVSPKQDTVLFRLGTGCLQRINIRVK